MSKAINPLLLDLPREIRGKRLTLRPYVEADAAALWDAVDASRKHLTPWMPWVDEWQQPEQAMITVRRNAARWILREDLTVGMFDAASGRLLGGSGLHRFDWSLPAMEIGYWIRPDEEGKGYVTEAVSLLSRYAFEHLKAERVEIRCDATNTRSAAIPPRAGFHHEGTLRAVRRNRAGELGDTMIFSMTRADAA